MAGDSMKQLKRFLKSDADTQAAFSSTITRKNEGPKKPKVIRETISSSEKIEDLSPSVPVINKYERFVYSSEDDRVLEEALGAKKSDYRKFQDALNSMVEKGELSVTDELNEPDPLDDLNDTTTREFNMPTTDENRENYVRKENNRDSFWKRFKHFLAKENPDLKERREQAEDSQKVSRTELRNAVEDFKATEKMKRMDPTEILKATNRQGHAGKNAKKWPI